MIPPGVIRLNRIAMRIAGVEPVVMYRGMTEVKKRDLEGIIGGAPEESGIIEVDDPVQSSEFSWWATSLGVAMAYATTDPAGGQKPGTRYDVLMVGELPAGMNKPTSGMGVVDLSRKKEDLRVTHVLYAKREGTSAERKARMKSMLDQAMKQAA